MIEGKPELQKKKRLQVGKLVSNLQRHASERAAAEARRVPWQLLFEARNQYLEWQEFYHWARSIIESEHGVPDWLAKKLNELCPGFLDSENQYLPRHSNESSRTAVRLGQWIDDQIFSFAKQGGWFLATTFYAVRESRYRKVSACWSQSVQRWTKSRPIRYPSFEEWLQEAARCDEAVLLLPKARKQRECFNLVVPKRLAQAVSLYIDWEAFGYWARLPLEAATSLPLEVARELTSRCPGFLELNNKARLADRRIPQDWHRLMLWIGKRYFEEAQREGWYDAILISASNHPRAIRTMEYFNRCEQVWESELPTPYPPFESWRRDADRYVDLAD